MREASSNGTYVQSINTVIDYIEKNIQKKLSLEQLAGIAGFSKYHFHRIFSAYMGETLNSFVMRLRAEKVAKIICCYPHKSFTEIAYECGFSDSSAFTKAFKRRFNLTPNEWVKQSDVPIFNSSRASDLLDFSVKDIFVSASLEYLPSFTLAYTRYIGRYAGDAKLFTSLFTKLHVWCEKHSIDMSKSKLFCLYHDSIDLTDEDKLRVSAGVEIKDDVATDEHIGKLKIARDKYLVAKFKVDETQYGLAWKYVFAYLLNEFNVKPASSPSFEMYEPCLSKKIEHNVSICVPLQ